MQYHTSFHKYWNCLLYFGSHMQGDRLEPEIWGFHYSAGKRLYVTSSSAVDSQRCCY